MKAYITQVQLGNIEIEGLMTEAGGYFIGIPQLVSSGVVPPNRSLKQIETLHGIEFSSHQKLTTDLNSKVVNAITIKDFERLLMEAAFKGSIEAMKLVRSLVGLSLHQLFSDAFGVEVTKQDRQASRISKGDTPIEALRFYGKYFS